MLWLAFGLTLFAGLSTGIGSFIALFAGAGNRKFLSGSLGFSAGVMIYVSLVEIFFKARDILVSSLGKTPGTWAATGAFFGGVLFIALIDFLVPAEENPHEMHRFPQDVPPQEQKSLQSLRRTGLFLAGAIALHNFPEGMATFLSALHDPKLGIAIALAIAIHNIPEGISVSVPIYFATGKKKTAFFYSFLSGLAEPAGALAGYFILRTFINDTIFGAMFAAVAGIMVFISIDELIPAAENYGRHHWMIYGFIAGMAVMALSLLLFI
jgi:zinc transporter, ZIP family